MRAGFAEVRIDREASFVDAIDFDDPPIREAMTRMNISLEEARGYADTLTSLQIFAMK